MPSIESVFRQWRACLRMPNGRGRSGWIAWLIVALLCVQMWGLQHEISHARELSGAAQRVSAAVDLDDPDSDLTFAGEGGGASTQAGFGFHHHCHLFEGATLAAAMAVAVLQWRGDTARANAPMRATGRSHASALQRPFDSRAPPVAV
ncbi:hypothetical protein [Pandoraea apista]|uniref:hypothetical protein n=1 Tax=Pandoraea apista TaxID=93218 RepID=UPI00065A3C7F|nr:hypothetical protein [Pandoraea apista]ALS66080.1 hypothetical protein AT395_14765 [Pandoraea apista]RRW95457.1 hypothetical protein EGJ54_13750 [Pandoraea apista]RRX04501.1 hypothetical protein EGJ56_08905 [Pandoraea apista]CFB62040.1 hypothetical protein LMG16407_02111 [Pandoraea apista]